MKKTRKIIKAFDKYKLQEKINEHIERGWKQVGDIKMEGYYDGAYAALIELELDYQAYYFLIVKCIIITIDTL